MTHATREGTIDTERRLMDTQRVLGFVLGCFAASAPAAFSKMLDTRTVTGTVRTDIEEVSR